MNWSAHFGIFNSSRLFGSMNVQAELDVRIASILSVVTEKLARGQMKPKERDAVVTYIALRWSAISLGIWLVWGRRSDCRSHLDSPMFHAPLVRRTAFRQLNARISGRLSKCHRSQCTASPPIIAPNHEWIPATTTVTYLLLRLRLGDWQRTYSNIYVGMSGQIDGWLNVRTNKYVVVSGPCQYLCEKPFRLVQAIRLARTREMIRKSANEFV